MAQQFCVSSPCCRYRRSDRECCSWNGSAAPSGHVMPDRLLAFLNMVVMALAETYRLSWPVLCRKRTRYWLSTASRHLAITFLNEILSVPQVRSSGIARREPVFCLVTCSMLSQISENVILEMSPIHWPVTKANSIAHCR